MSQVSKKFLDEKVRQRILEVFLTTLIDLKNTSDAQAFFDCLLTETEKTMLAKRLVIAILLAKNYDYRTISRLLKVSTTTVHTVNLKKQFLPQAFSQTVSKFMSREEWEKFWDEIEEAAPDVSSILGSFKLKRKAAAMSGIYERQKQRPF